MSKALIVIVFLILGSVGGYFIYKYFTSSQATNKKPLANYTEPFMWGVTMRPNALGNYQPEIWVKQTKLAKNLGVGWARLTWDYENVDPLARNDDVIKYLSDSNIQTLLVIEQDSRQEVSNNYQDGYDDGFEIASHYKGKIKFYQMINEGGAQTIKDPTWNGQTEDQYDEAKYKPLSEYLKGLSEGIAKGDPDAWRILSISYTHTGFLDKVVKDNINFDIIGIDWYDWMGPIEKKKLDDGQMFIDKLKSYNKPFIFTEVNAVPHGKNKNDKSHKIVDEDAQSEFIAQTAKWAWENQDYVKGFYVLELIDNINNKSENAEYFGIVTATKANVIGELRKAYNTYQDIIKQSLGQ